MSQKQNHFMGTTDMCNANCSGGSRGALNLETNFAFSHLSSTSLSVHWGKIVCSTMHYLSLKGHSSTMKIWGHSDLDPGNDITSYFYLLFLSQGVFLLNVLSLSLDTHFKYLVCNFPPNYIIIAYLPFRLTQPYPGRKMLTFCCIHVTLAERLSHCSPAPLQPGFSSVKQIPSRFPCLEDWWHVGEVIFPSSYWEWNSFLKMFFFHVLPFIKEVYLLSGSTALMHPFALEQWVICTVRGFSRVNSEAYWNEYTPQGINCVLT